MKLIIDDQGVLRILTEMEDRLQDLSPVMRAIEGEFDDRVQQAFEDEADPVTGAAWPELKAATIAARRRRNVRKAKGKKNKALAATEGLKILLDTGTLRASVLTDSDHNSVSIHVGEEYGEDHQVGNPRINLPQRRFAGISPDDEIEFQDLIKSFILNG